MWIGQERKVQSEEEVAVVAGATTWYRQNYQYALYVHLIVYKEG